MVDLVAAGRRPSELAKEFGCHETSILSWVRIARAATPSLSNLPPTLHESERAELLALRKEVRQIIELFITHDITTA
jgi:transposase